MHGPAGRLGLTVAATRHLALEALTELAQAAERAGFESVWVPETWGADAVTVLALLARETGSIRLASGVFNVFSRSAMVLAQTAATLQEASAGRFVLGLGASGPVVVENWHGVPFDRPVARTRGYIEAIRLALSGSRVDCSGEVVRLAGFRLLNPPERPVPIYLAALGPRNVALTGALADGWLPIFAARGHLQPLMEQLRKGAEEAGRDPAAIDVAAYIPLALGPRAEILLRQQLAYYVGGMGTFYAGMLNRIGFEQDVTRIRDRWSTGDRVGAVKAVSDALLDACTVSGSAGEARARLDQYRAEGIALPIAAPPHGTTLEEAHELIAALARN